MNDRHTVAIIAAILIGKRGNGELINEEEAVSDAIGIWTEARKQCDEEGIFQDMIR